MSVILNHAINGHSATSVDPDYVVFPSAQEIVISGPGDTITPVDNNGNYVPLATAAKQDTGNTSLSSIDGKVATAANQTTANNSLAAINGKLNSLGQKTQSGSVPVVRPAEVTYSAAISGLVVQSGATDFFTITGSASKTVKVRRLQFTGTAGANRVSDILLYKRSTANSGGTSTTVTEVPHLSSDAAATATVRAYTANPTLGTTVGLLRSTSAFISGTNSNQAQVIDFRFDDYGTKSLILSGTSEVLSVNLNALSISGGVVASVMVIWTEE